MTTDDMAVYATAAPLYYQQGWRGILPIPAGKKVGVPGGFTGCDGTPRQPTARSSAANHPQRSCRRRGNCPAAVRSIVHVNPAGPVPFRRLRAGRMVARGLLPRFSFDLARHDGSVLTNVSRSAQRTEALTSAAPGVFAREAQGCGHTHYPSHLRNQLNPN